MDVLLRAFMSYQSARDMFEDVIEPLLETNPEAAILALEGLHRMESEVGAGQFIPAELNIRNFLRKWSRESKLDSYSDYFKRVPKVLRSLTIFKTLEVPLFIDDYGRKILLSNYGNGETEDIQIDGNTPISHDTHAKEARKIRNEKRLKPSKNKNIIKGCWFGLDISNSSDSSDTSDTSDTSDSSDSSDSSVYGSKRFKTTLLKLGVTGLHQGEIVSYKNEVNVILYAGDDTTFEGLKKPTDKAVRKAKPGAYAKVSIFVPARFLPSQEDFSQVVSGPYEVKHGPFCVKAKRSHEPCEELKQALRHKFGQLGMSEDASSDTN